jgi:hypothetical protein
VEIKLVAWFILGYISRDVHEKPKRMANQLSEGKQKQTTKVLSEHTPPCVILKKNANFYTGIFID